MAILYGTQSNGETLPVEVNEFGQLVAKGIEGEPGQPGPPGPPGIGQLPPNPFEGAVLGWQDNELAWLGGSVPLPAGTYGPYTYVPGNEQLDIPQDARSLVNGQQLYMSDSQGILAVADLRTDKIANVSGNTLTFPTDNNFDKFEVGDVVQGAPLYSDYFSGNLYVEGLDPAVWLFADDQTGGETCYAAFDGSLSTFATWTAPDTSFFKNATKLRLLYRSADTKQKGCKIKVNESDAMAQFPYAISGDSTMTLSSGLQSISFQSFDTGNYTGLKRIYVDDILLLDSDLPPKVKITAIDNSVPSITVDGGSWTAGESYLETKWSGAGSVFVGLDGAIVLRNNNMEWADNFYVTAPEQEIAARKVAANATKLRKK
jgi:hypothetical protein